MPPEPGLHAGTLVGPIVVHDEMPGEFRRRFGVDLLEVPYLHGYDLAIQARALRPDMRVLFMSGYEDSHLLNRVAPGEAITLLQKPFSADDLLKKVREVLSAPR